MEDFLAQLERFALISRRAFRGRVRIDRAEKEVAPHIREWDRSGAQADTGPETRTHIQPLLARMGEATVSLPGGCAIGLRPVGMLGSGAASVVVDWLSGAISQSALGS